jgi:hypothetical protein
MSAKNKKTAVKTESKTNNTKAEFVFGNNNYMLMIIGFVVLVTGFILMYGGKEDIYSFRRITLAPIVVISGFVIEIFAILVKPKGNTVNESN